MPTPRASLPACNLLLLPALALSYALSNPVAAPAWHRPMAARITAALIATHNSPSL